MNKDKYVFAQLTECLDYPKFRRLVRKYRGDSYIKRFTYWNQLLTLMFGQLGGRESLRNLVTVLEAHQSKCYHLGLDDRPASRNAVSLANQTRDCRIFEELASFMMEEAGREYLAIAVFLPRGDCAQETWNQAIRLRDATDTQRLPDRHDLRAGTL